ncbi:tetratricopeptide repeat protein [Abyssalbus ytuae]|uniref:Tetratricopeptide repeat protein n=1 Tax=Abyssalbus ytuae TaxID=2926907 RepID=A0A9E7CTU7_9FLAO|nr:hypothetical protein [Abyssalbus ytuae]UOB18731.1 hypothetical protein MQE35_05420 [Abyssalbus ytuae]
MINKVNIEEMKSRITLITAFFVAFVFSMKVQAQNPECNTNLSLFAADAKAGNYDGAYEPWKMVYETCPALHYATYAYGERILKHKIKNATGAEKTNLLNMLLGMYDASLQHFPAKFSKSSVAIDKVLLKQENNMITDDEIYEELNKAFTEDKENFKNPKALYMYFSTLVDLHKAGKKELQEVFDAYDNVTGKIEEENKALTEVIGKLVEKEDTGTLTSKEKKTLESARTNGESFEKISSSIDSKLGQLADCENLIPLYQKDFENKKTDADWLRKAAGRMDSKDCTDDPLFIKMVEALHTLEPSAESAYYLGLLKDKARKGNEAIKYYNEAVGLQSDKYKKAKLLLKIASKYAKRGSKSTARKYANEALANNPSEGNAYLILANIYGNSANECGSTTFEKKAVYWRAADMARKAAQVDPSVRSKALDAARRYEGLAPSRTEIFTSGFEGKTITFKCWIGGSVRVPKL